MIDGGFGASQFSLDLPIMRWNAFLFSIHLLHAKFWQPAALFRFAQPTLLAVLSSLQGIVSHTGVGGLGPCAVEQVNSASGVGAVQSLIV